MKLPLPNSSNKLIIIIIVFFISIYLMSNDSHPLIGCKGKEVSQLDSLIPWRYPSVNSIKDDEEGKNIKLGRKIFTETYKFVGPDVKDSSKRYLGNNMDCQNCHFNAGTQQFVLGLVGTYSQYPAFDPRTNKTITLEERINSCMQRSMNGKAMPVDGPEMKAIVSYIKWLGSDIPKGAKFIGGGLPKIDLLKRAADPSNGKIVYDNYCTNCHAADGSGVLNKAGNIDVPADSLKGYDYPPIMGDDSYNQNAGMYRLLTAAAFIHAKMPLNASHLSVESSFDVAAYINTMPRPINNDLTSDYPDLKLKPVDYPFPPFADGFTELEHKYGPYLTMIKEGEVGKYVDPIIWKK